jgi:septum formation protein
MSADRPFHAQAQRTRIFLAAAPFMTEIPIILASGSATRRRLMAAAGLHFSVATPTVDEDAIRDAVRRSHGSTETAVSELALAKAFDVGRGNANALVVGADQILDCAGCWLGKPGSRAAARAQLEALSGRSHRLVTGICLTRRSEAVWRHVDTALLVMKALDAAAIERYLDAAGPGIFESVGAYQIEGFGIQLFAEVRGDYFSILGLPLIPLLAALARHDVTLP